MGPVKRSVSIGNIQCPPSSLIKPRLKEEQRNTPSDSINCWKSACSGNNVDAPCPTPEESFQSYCTKKDFDSSKAMLTLCMGLYDIHSLTQSFQHSSLIPLAVGNAIVSCCLLGLVHSQDQRLVQKWYSILLVILVHYLGIFHAGFHFQRPRSALVMDSLHDGEIFVLQGILLLCILGHGLHMPFKYFTALFLEMIAIVPSLNLFVAGCIIGYSLYKREYQLLQHFARVQQLGSENMQLSKQNRDIYYELSSQLSNSIESNMESVLRILSHLKSRVGPQSRESFELDSVIKILLSESDLYDVRYDSDILKNNNEQVQGWLRILHEKATRNTPNLEVSAIKRTRSCISQTIDKHIQSYFRKREEKFSAHWFKSLLNDASKEVNMFELAQVCDHPLAACLISVLESEFIFHALPVPISHVIRFITTVESRYRPVNAYHNAMHAAAVLLDVNFYLKNLKHEVNDIQCYSALLSAAVHDVNHPGMTNAFMVHSKSSLAMVYSDDSVLERMHLAETFQIASKEDCNIFTNLTRKQSEHSRQMIIQMVLATDMAHHLKHVNVLKRRQFNVPTSQESSELNTGFVLETIMIMADLGHATKSFDYHRQWSERITEEFFRQGDIERERGLPISPLCNRHDTPFAASQVGFFDFVVKPLFSAVKLAIPIEGFEHVLSRVDANAAMWKKLSLEEKDDVNRSDRT